MGEIDAITPEMIQSVTGSVESVIETVGSSSNSVSFPPEIAAMGAAIAAVTGGIAAMTGKTKSETKEENFFMETEPEPIDVSIPYDAAARLAFAAMASNPKDEDLYYQFEAIYEEKTVADVTVKKMERELNEKKQQASALNAQMEALFTPPTEDQASL